MPIVFGAFRRNRLELVRVDEALVAGEPGPHVDIRDDQRVVDCRRTHPHPRCVSPPCCCRHGPTMPEPRPCSPAIRGGIPRAWPLGTTRTPALSPAHSRPTV